jgi:hypothetical protein
MAESTFMAQSGANIVRAATPQDAVRQFLAAYKNRIFTVVELRDGVCTTQLSVGPGAGDDTCFSKRFASRAAARAFCQAAQPAA